MTDPVTTPLSAEDQRTTGDVLQTALVDLIDLSLIGKQAHWTVIGPHFRSLHLALDELVDAARGFTDDVAERATAIGVAPDGRADTVASTTVAKSFGAGWSPDTGVIDAIVDNLAGVIERLRNGIAITEDTDPVTQDLLIAVTARLEQLHWMWQAQRG